MTPSLLMLLPFGVVIAVGFLFIRMASREIPKRKTSRLKEALEALDPGNDPEPGPEQPWLQMPSRWLAIRGAKPAAVRNVLDLCGVQWCSLAEGLQFATEDRFFISLHVKNWVLVFGRELPDAESDPDNLFRFLTNLSRELGTVQYFCADAVVGEHAWVWLERGKVTRAFAWSGTTLWNQGEMTSAERSLGMDCPDYGEDLAEPLRRNAMARHNVERVHQLAGRWGLEPGRLTQYLPKGAQGIVGKRRLPRRSRP